jgi:hypothetical protein
MMLRGFPEACPGDELDLEIAASRVPGRRTAWTVTCGDLSHSAAPGVAAAARWVEWLLTSQLVKRWTRFVHVHAGLVSNGEQSTLLIGRSGSGKSTTTVALALDGLELFTDDVALVDRETLRPYCVPRPVKLDQAARRLLRPRGLNVPRGTWLGESIDRTIIPGLPDIHQPGPPITSALFFANGREGKASIRRISSAEGVMRLILQSASERFDSTGPSDGATALINAVTCYELTPGDLASTVQAVKDVLDHGVTEHGAER